MEVLLRVWSYPKAILDFVYNNIFWFHLSSLIFSALFIAGTIYSIVKSPYINIKIEGYIDAFGIKTLSRRRARRVWRRVLERVNKGTATNFKLAILEADRLLDEILKLSGFYGETMDDRLKQATEKQIANLDDIKEAHHLATRIANDPDWTMDRKTAIETLKVYEKLFEEFGIVD